MPYMNLNALHALNELNYEGEPFSTEIASFQPVHWNRKMQTLHLAANKEKGNYNTHAQKGHNYY